MPLFDLIQSAGSVSRTSYEAKSALESGMIATNALNSVEKRTCDYINAVRAANGRKRIKCVYVAAVRKHAKNLAAGKYKTNPHYGFATRAKGHRSAGENVSPTGIAIYHHPTRNITLAKRAGRTPFVKSGTIYKVHSAWKKLQADWKKNPAESAVLGWWDDMANAKQTQKGMGHRKNMLNKTWDKVAVGYAKNAKGRGYIVADFFYK